MTKTDGFPVNQLLLAFFILWAGLSNLSAHPIPQGSEKGLETGWYYHLQPQINFSHASQADQIPRWGYANLDQVQGGFKAEDWLVHGKFSLAITSDVLTTQMGAPSSVWFDIKNLYFTWTPAFLQTTDWRAGVTVGRIRINDFTQEILDHDFDGVSLFWKDQTWETRLETGYSGFLGKRNSLLEDSTLDFLERQPALVLTPSDWTDYNDPSHPWDMPREVLTSLTKWKITTELSYSLGLIYLLDLRSFLAPGSVVSTGTTTYDSSHGGDLNCFYAQSLLQIDGNFPGWIDLVFQKGQALMYRVKDSAYKTTTLTAYSLGGAWGPAFLDKKLVLQGFLRFNSGDEASRAYPLQAFVTQGSETTSYFPLVTDNAILGAPFYGGNVGIAGAQIIWDDLGWKTFPHKLSLLFKSLFKTNSGPLMVQGFTGNDRDSYLGWSTECFASVRPLAQTEVSLGWSLVFPNTGANSYWENLPITWVSRTSLRIKMDF